jgi:hypothetical protein
MALPAIDLDRGIGVTAVAEVLAALDADRLVIRPRHHMALDTLLEAVLLGTNALVHGIVPMV